MLLPHRRNFAGIILLILSGLILLVFARRQPEKPLPSPDYSKVGIHLLLDDGRNHWPVDLWRLHMEYAAQIVAPRGIVVQVIRADDLDLVKWQFFMDLCAEYDLTPVLRLATTFNHTGGYWMPPRPDAEGHYVVLAEAYANFASGLQWPAEQKHLILLNEPNNGVEWGGKPDPASYARFFVDVATTLHEHVPGVVILNAAFDLYAPDTGSARFGKGWRYISATRFMDEMRSAEPDVFTHIDLWNSHAYPPGAFRAPPWEQVYQFDVMGDTLPVIQHPPEGVFNRGVNGYEWELWKLSTYGVDALPVMITETGWRQAVSAPDSLDAGVEYPDPETAAMYLDLAMRGNDGRYADVPEKGWIPWLRDERVAAIAPFALNGTPREWAHTNLLRLNTAGEVTGASAMFDVLVGYQKG